MYITHESCYKFLSTRADAEASGLIVAAGGLSAPEELSFFLTISFFLDLVTLFI